MTKLSFNNLYCYGDSYVWSSGFPNNWSNQLAKKLDANLVDCGYPGFGILQTFEKWYQNIPLYKEGDQIVIMLSHPDRTYFFKKDPGFSQVGNALSNKNKDTANEMSAMIEYYKHLHSNMHILWFTKCWQHWIDSVSAKLKIKTIVIPLFNEVLPALDYTLPNQIIFKNPIYNISRRELADDKFLEIFENKIDPRENHLCFSNHKILCDTIFQSIITGKLVEIDWIDGCVTSENLQNDKWVSSELSYEKFNNRIFFTTNIFNEVIKSLRTL